MKSTIVLSVPLDSFPSNYLICSQQALFVWAMLRSVCQIITAGVRSPSVSWPPGLGLHRPRADQDGPGAESVLAPAVRAGPGLISADIIAIISAGLITPRWLTMEFAYLRSFVLDACIFNHLCDFMNE